MMPAEQDIDTLAGLEDRVLRAVEMVQSLRSEKEAAVQAAAAANREVARLTEEVNALHAERKHVRARIEKLLGQIDQLSAG